jgi:hypothetical protein
MTDKHERLSTIHSLQLGFYACSELIGKPGGLGEVSKDVAALERKMGFRTRERMTLNDEYKHNL